MQFNGFYFNPQIHPKKVQVKIQFIQNQVQLSGEGVQQSFHLNQLDLKKGGANNHLFFFYPQNQEDSSFYFEQSKLATDFLKGLRQIHWQETLNKRDLINLSTLGVTAFLLLTLLAYGIYYAYSNSNFSKYIATKIPYTYEKQLGQMILKAYLPDQKKYKKIDTLNALKDLLKPLKTSLPSPYKDLEIYIQISDELNAFALPGGIIVFTTETLKQVTSPEEILGVAAHEMAHITERHILRSMAANTGIRLFLIMLTGSNSQQLETLFSGSGLLLSRSFSRDMESEADKVGFSYLLKANINPIGMLHFFQRILRRYQTKDDQKPSVSSVSTLEKSLEFLSTHPNTANRIQQIQKMISENSVHQKNTFLNLQSSFKLLKTSL